MGWFEHVFGFREEDAGGYNAVKSQFQIDSNNNGDILLTSLPTHRQFHVGRFETPTLQELRDRAQELHQQEPNNDNTCTASLGDGLTFQHIVGNAADLHRAPENRGAVFQAASQFNCLEMVGPRVTPEMGVTRYVQDRTQGPTCALACPAGTVYRNYFAREKAAAECVSHGQLDMLRGVGEVVGNHVNNNEATQKPVYWKMLNGYALPSRGGSVAALSQRLQQEPGLKERAVAQLRVGVHWNTEVDTEEEANQETHCVAQVYCSALPLAYDNSVSSYRDWEPFARMVLEGAYEATLAAATVLAHQRQHRVPVFLTMLGGGAFGNPPSWIVGAIERALELHQEAPLDVSLVHYGRVDPTFAEIRLREKEEGYRSCGNPL